MDIFLFFVRLVSSFPPSFPCHTDHLWPLRGKWWINSNIGLIYIHEGIFDLFLAIIFKMMLRCVIPLPMLVRVLSAVWYTNSCVFAAQNNMVRLVPVFLPGTTYSRIIHTGTDQFLEIYPQKILAEISVDRTGLKAHTNYATSYTKR